MRHRSSSSPPEIDLFPFLSILFCTIGTLVLIIILLVVQANGNTKKVTIIAKNSGSINQNKIPLYVECQKNGVIIHPSQEFVATEDLNQTNSVLNQLFSQIKAEKEEYIIVAIRPDGIEVFQKIRELIESKGIDIGYEPIDQDWQLQIKPSK